MKGEELKRLRERAGLSRDELAVLLNEALDRKYDAASVSKWERDRVSIPEHVATMAGAVAVTNVLTLEEELSPPPLGPEDSAPTDPNPPRASVPLSSSGAWSKPCAELFEIIATGVGMTGAALGSAKLMQDGAIIAADKDQLGEAWGKLAETNASFRNMLVGLTSGGAWLQVAVVTGSTIGKCWQNHATPEWSPDGRAANGHVPGGSPPQPDQAAA